MLLLSEKTCRKPIGNDVKEKAVENFCISERLYIKIDLLPDQR